MSNINRGSRLSGVGGRSESGLRRKGMIDLKSNDMYMIRICFEVS